MTRGRPIRAGQCVLAAAALSALLAACGSSGSGQAVPTSALPATSTPPASSQTPSPSVSAPSSAVSTSAPPLSPTGPSATLSTVPSTAITPQRCHTASLQPSSVTDVPGELGKEFAVVLRNNGGVTCQAQGWPGVSFVDAAGKDLGDAERRGSAPQVRTLPPGSTVLVTVGVSNPAGGNGCVGGVPDSRTVLLTPPNETAQLSVALPHVFLVCHPIVYPIGSAAQGS